MIVSAEPTDLNTSKRDFRDRGRDSETGDGSVSNQVTLSTHRYGNTPSVQTLVDTGKKRITICYTQNTKRDAADAMLHGKERASAFSPPFAWFT